MVFSEAAQERAQKRVRKQLARWRQQEKKAFDKLAKQVFACREDAERALADFAATLKATSVEAVEVLECAHYDWPAGKMAPDRLSYCLRGRLRECERTREELLLRKSLFILTTNEDDKEALSATQVLLAYKGQTQIERGFRFLKDPLFLASSLFLRSEKRIMALLMVMTLCLMVYAALEWRIRQGLRDQEQSFPDQKGKPTQRPTARWVFQCFVGIHVLLVAQQQLVLNLDARHEVILAVLGQRYQLFYASHHT